ncbi:MAG: right-handed parallel beta-helix repeat-containing protein [Phycisphaerales bacterium]
MNRTALLCTTIASLSILAAALVVAGPLNPPSGAVASTYKTLTEVEPRIAINSTNTPGDADSVFRIRQPGAYYLTGKVTGASGKMGIEIAASNVTVDLNGFEVQGVTGALDGISCTLPSASVISVENGSVCDWPLDGIDLGIDIGYGGHLDRVVASGNTGDGIKAGIEYTVTRCSSLNNGGYGFSVSSSCTMSNCAAYGNALSGVSCRFACTLSDCTASFNYSDGFLSVYAGNSLHNCTASSNDGHGFDISYSSSIVNCASYINGGDGFRISNSNVLIGNTSSYNGQGASGGCGVMMTGMDNRVEGNNCSNSTYGIRALTSGNFISRNICSGNTTNWNVVAGNVCLVVNATTTGGTINGNSGGTAPGSTDPNANFTY